MGSVEKYEFLKSWGGPSLAWMDCPKKLRISLYGTDFRGVCLLCDGNLLRFRLGLFLVYEMAPFDIWSRHFFTLIRFLYFMSSVRIHSLAYLSTASKVLTLPEVHAHTFVINSCFNLLHLWNHSWAGILWNIEIIIKTIFESKLCTHLAI